jgi:deoxyribodipyrimidine photo-lyase
MTAYRRLSSNFALQHAVDVARRWQKPLVMLEAVRCDYPWASDRLHTFILDGMAEHADRLSASPITYIPYVEPARGAGRGLLERLSARACLVITDDFPSFFIPRMVAAAGARIDVRLDAVDSNGILPTRGTDRVFLTARSFRSHLQGELRSQLAQWPASLAVDDLIPGTTVAREIAAVLSRWPSTPAAVLKDPRALLLTLPIDHSVPPAPLRGGSAAARKTLSRFVADRLSRYADDHSHPDKDATSGLSPYLHFGHISAHDVFDAVMNAERWTSRKLGTARSGQREGWWGTSQGAEAFLDQVLTWRELGFNMCTHRPADYWRYESLPAWARATLDRHTADPRAWVYSRDEFSNAATHDPVWNAAQRELVATGTCHGYLRMLWGKKILEWSRTPEDALETMIAVMDRFALDGRDPNSYSGYCWTLGRYDRPWFPERPIYGTIRYMTSGSTIRKLRMKRYLDQWGDGAMRQ